MKLTSHELNSRARAIAEHVLRPNAVTTDGADQIPDANMRALADEGLFGTLLATDDPMRATMGVAEVLASACLPTAFVWAQQQGAFLRLLSAPQEVRQTWSGQLAGGRSLAGVTYAGLPSHGESLHIEDGALFGTAPFVTSWPRMNLLVAWASAGQAANEIVWLAIPDPQRMPGVTSNRLNLIAGTATDTHRVDFDGARIDPSWVCGSAPRSKAIDIPLIVHRHNSTLGIGLLNGIISDLNSSGLDCGRYVELQNSVRADLDAALVGNEPADMTRARGRLLRGVFDAATDLYLVGGAKSVASQSLGSRRLREAAFVQSAATGKNERDVALVNGKSWR